MDNITSELEFLRRQCNALGARVLRLQEDKTNAHRDARRHRTTTTLIREIYRLSALNVALTEIGQKFVGILLDTLNVDRIGLLRYTASTQSFAFEHRLGFAPNAPSKFTPPFPLNNFYFASSATAITPIIITLQQIAGGPYFLWTFNPETELALLVSNSTEDHHLHRPFETADQELIEGAISVFVEIVERKRTEEALREHATRLEILRKIDSAVLEAQLPQEIAQTTLACLRYLITYEYAGILEFDFNTATAVILSNYSPFGANIEHLADIPLADLDLVSMRQPTIINDIELPAQPPRFLQFINSTGIRSLILMPLLEQGQAIGLFYIGSLRPNAFSAEYIEMISEVTCSLAVAIRQARLHEALRIQAEKLSSSLQEKEVLLKEVHHRVKNNLQIISSLLNLQSAFIKDEQILEIFRDSQYRVRSMALIHEKLYLSNNLAEINFAEYIYSLVNTIFRTMGMQRRGINVQIQAENILLKIDAAVPCGLIVNELVSNTLKHAFPNGNTGVVQVQLNAGANGHIMLSVADNGVGLPPGLNFKETESLGLQLVNSLVRQLGGVIDLDQNSGTKFTITFTDDNQN